MVIETGLHARAMFRERPYGPVRVLTGKKPGPVLRHDITVSPRSGSDLRDTGM